MRRVDKARRPGKSRSSILCHEKLMLRPGGYPLRLRLSSPEYVFIRDDEKPVFVSVLKQPDSPLSTPEMLVVKELLACGLECWCYDPHRKFRRLVLSPVGDDVIPVSEGKRAEKREEG